MREIIRQKIVDALAVQPPVMTRRDVHVPQIPGMVRAVIGMRRSGKTTFLWQQLAARLAAGAPRESLLYFSFEDERLAGMTAADLAILSEEYYTLCPPVPHAAPALFLLDEIQVVPGWESFVRRLHDEGTTELWISGSSARLLSREVATSMRGRAVECVVHPYSFREYLRHAHLEPELPLRRLPSADRAALQSELMHWLREGGFPASVGLSDRDRATLLQSYVDTVLLRDVIERHQVSNPTALRWMVRSLLANPGGLFSVQKFYHDLRSQGLPIAKDTLHAYLAHLEDAFLVRLLSVAGGSERRRMVNPRKSYVIDTGLCALYSHSPTENLGHNLENAAMLELERRGATLQYLRTQAGTEIDFVARYGNGTVQLIQVCADPNAPGVWERELRALASTTEYPEAQRILLCLYKPSAALMRELPDGVQVQLALNWFLEAPVYSQVY